MITGIIVALAEEIGTLTKKKIQLGGCLFISENILLAYSGAGPDNALKAAHQVLANGADRIISWGCAAAIDKTLIPGDLTLPKTLLAENLQQFSVHTAWHRHASEYLSEHFEVKSGLLMESSRIISSSSEKLSLHDNTAAVIVDMESVAIARAAVKAERPLLVIRVIVDPATMNLPNAINYAVNNNGEVNIKKIITYLLRHPGEISELIKLGRCFQSATNKLKLVAKHIDTITNYTQSVILHQQS